MSRRSLASTTRRPAQRPSFARCPRSCSLSLGCSVGLLACLSRGCVLLRAGSGADDLLPDCLAIQLCVLLTEGGELQRRVDARTELPEVRSVRRPQSAAFPGLVGYGVLASHLLSPNTLFNPHSCDHREVQC